MRNEVWGCAEIWPRVELYIANGWDKKFLKDPDGKFFEQKQKEEISDQCILLEKILDREAAGQHLWRISSLTPTQLWRSFSRGLPIQNIQRRAMHSSGSKHRENRYESIVCLTNDNMLLLEGDARPAMKQAKRIQTIWIVSVRN